MATYPLPWESQESPESPYCLCWFSSSMPTSLLPSTVLLITIVTIDHNHNFHDGTLVFTAKSLLLWMRIPHACARVSSQVQVPGPLKPVPLKPSKLSAADLQLPGVDFFNFHPRLKSAEETWRNYENPWKIHENPWLIPQSQSLHENPELQKSQKESLVEADETSILPKLNEKHTVQYLSWKSLQGLRIHTVLIILKNQQNCRFSTIHLLESIRCVFREVQYPELLFSVGTNLCDSLGIQAAPPAPRYPGIPDPHSNPQQEAVKCQINGQINGQIARRFLGFSGTSCWIENSIG